MKTFFLLLLSFITVNITMADTNKVKVYSMEIFTMDWSAETILAYNTQRFLEEAQNQCFDITSIRIMDSNYIKKVILKIPDSQDKNNYCSTLDVRCVCLIHYPNEKTDTLSFGRNSCFVCNGNSYKLDLGMLELIGIKLPYFYRDSFDRAKMYIVEEDK